MEPEADEQTYSSLSGFRPNASAAVGCKHRTQNRLQHILLVNTVPPADPSSITLHTLCRTPGAEAEASKGKHCRLVLFEVGWFEQGFWVHDSLFTTTCRRRAQPQARRMVAISGARAVSSLQLTASALETEAVLGAAGPEALAVGEWQLLRALCATQHACRPETGLRSVAPAAHRIRPVRLQSPYALPLGR